MSDFGLTDAIESGLVKIPQLAVRDSTGQGHPRLLQHLALHLGKLTPAERGGDHANPRPEAILKWPITPSACSVALGRRCAKSGQARKDDPRPPVFILVCRNTRIAKVIYEWLAEDKAPAGHPTVQDRGISQYATDAINTIRVDSRVVQETDSAEAKERRDPRGCA